MIQRITKEYFEPVLHQKVQIQFSPEVYHDFEVVELRVSPKIESLQIEPFSILFRGSPSCPVYQQGTYLMKSAEIGEMHIFLNPRLPDKEGIYYEAIFN